MGIASRLLGKRLKRLRGVYLGMPADDVLKVWGEGLEVEVVQRSPHGLVVRWLYEDAILTMRRRRRGKITCYRVARIEMRR